MTVVAQLESSSLELAISASRESRRVRPGRLLPYDVFLCQGTQSLRVFAKGPLDEFTFFQRRDVPQAHQVEYLTRLEPRDDGKERFTAYGMIRLGEALPFPALDRLRPLWSALRERLGLDWLPSARPYLRSSGAHSPHQPGGGVNRIRATPGSGSFQHQGSEVHFCDVLDVLRDTLSGAERVAWVETAFAQAPATLTHRYYLDSDLGVFLVRHHPSEGKRLFSATISAQRERGLLVYVPTPSGRLALEP
ncbi:MAG: hypothetical protein R3F62_03335 [Planctomycetota bacterium]